MTNINQQISFGLAVSWRACIALGLPFLFIPINTLCYAGVPQEKNNEVSGLTALSRNVGGSVGISFVTTLLARFSPAPPGHAHPQHGGRQPPLRPDEIGPRRSLQPTLWHAASQTPPSTLAPRSTA